MLMSITLLLGFQIRGRVPAVNEYDTFEKLWNEIDTLESHGLTKTALEKTTGIYILAKKSGNSPQIIKSLIYQIKYKQILEEGGFEKALSAFEEEIREAEFPEKNILQSAAAELYWNYYQQNRWRFSDRTHTLNFNQDDISTWDLRKLTERVTALYEESLTNVDSLKQLPIDLFASILIRGDMPAVSRPTLYDFLAHRALDHFMNDEPYIIQPSYRFNISGYEVFAPAKAFMDLRIETRDSTSGKLLAINILQNLLQFHKDDPSPDALIDIELKRFQFLRNKSIHDLKDSLYLHGLIDLETVYGKDSASAAVSFAIAQFYFDRSAEYAPPLINDNQWDKKQALDYCIKVITHFPSTSAVVNCKALQQLIEAKNILLTVEQVNTPNQPFRGLIEYRNVNQIFFRVIKDPDSLIQNMRQPDEVKKYEVYLRQPILQQWSQPVVDLHDFQQHATEIKIPALPLGRYIILGSSTENFSIYDGAIINAGTTISNISYISNRNKDSYSFYILDRETGQPLRLAKARILTQFYESSTRNYQFKETGKYTADENGYFELPVSADNQNFRIEFSHGEDILMADDHFYLFHQEEIKEKIIRTVFFTDRAIFRPGQTIYFKGIMLQSDGGPNELMTKFSTTVELYDMNGQKIQSQNLVTNEYGSFIGTFTAPSNGLKGEMMIRNIFGSTSISVEEYKRPRFEVLFDTLKGSHRLNDIVNVGGMAKSYAGANLDGATVNYRVVRQGRFPIWNYGYRQSHPNWISNEMEIVNGQTKAGADGSFKFSFTAIPDLKIPKKESPVFDFKIIADVVDISGETHTSEAFISIGYISLNANVLIPETVSTDFLNKFEIITTNLNGIFEAASGTLNVYPLDEPDRILRARLWKRPDQFVMNEESFHKIFPYDVYDNEDDFTSWPRGHSVLNQQFNTALDRSFILPKTIAPGKYLLELIGKDKYGEELKVQKYFTSYSSKDKHIPLKTSLWATQLPDTATNIHTVHFYAGSAEKDMTVIYEIRSKDFVKNKLLKWQKDGIHDLSFMISPDMKSSATITILAVRHGRVYSLNKTIAILADEKNLKIDIGTFRNKLLPGETEEWSLKITGSKGEAMAAEMVASLYDASLDAFRTNTWNFEPDQLYYPSASWTAGNCFGIKNSEYFAPSWNINGSFLFPVYDQLNWFGFNGGYGYLLRGRQNQEMFNESAATEQKPVNGALQKQELNTSAADANNVDETREQQRFQQASVRKNLQETAFFYPQLQTDGDGNVIIKFTMPEALTRWKFLAFAHTKDLRYGMISNEILTQKDLMVVPNAPRFFREGDEIFFSAKVTNLSEADITGSVILQLYDAITMKPIDTLFSIENRFQSFNATKKQSVSIFWKLRIPSGVEAVDYKVIATAGNQSDGEEDVVPILSDKIFVTETLPLNVRGNSTKNYSFSPLLKSTSSSTLKHYNLTLEFTGNPMWYAIQALPYLMEYPYQSSEQTFNRFYSNALA